METTVDEINDGIYRLSTYVPEADFMFNQFVIDAEEPLLFHCGPRQLFPLVSEALARIVPLERLRWITFGHVESDECGSMNEWLAAAPRAEVAHTGVGCMVSVNDLADRPPRAVADGEVIDLGGKRVRHLDTPHVPHGWDAHLLFEETTGTLLCGDLFTATGKSPALTEDDIVEPALLFLLLLSRTVFLRNLLWSEVLLREVLRAALLLLALVLCQFGTMALSHATGANLVQVCPFCFSPGKLQYFVRARR